MRASAASVRRRCARRFLIKCIWTDILFMWPNDRAMLYLDLPEIRTISQLAKNTEFQCATKHRPTCTMPPRVTLRPCLPVSLPQTDTPSPTAATHAPVNLCSAKHHSIYTRGSCKIYFFSSELPERLASPPPALAFQGRTMPAQNTMQGILARKPLIVNPDVDANSGDL